MFWVGLLIALLSGVASIDIFRDALLRRCPRLGGWHVDLIIMALIVLGLGLAAYDHGVAEFKLDYVNSDGDISNYYPDFLVKLTDGRIVVVETKGQEDLDVPLKVQRIRQWCEDINGMQSDVTYDFVYVDEEGFKKYEPKSFADLLASFREYKEKT